METIANLSPACETESPDQAQMRPVRSGKTGIRVLSLLMGCAIAGFSQTALAQTVLKKGSSGQAVTELQIRLQELNCFDGSITDYFGDQTEAGVIRCQERAGLAPDGIVGPETYRALGLGGSSTPVQDSSQYSDRLQLGDRGQAVQQVQARLRDLGYYYGPVDGVFGSETQSAVAQLQRDYNLSQTGAVDASVYSVLDSTPSQPAGSDGLRPGDRSPRVVELQRQLNRLGYPVPIDGVYGTQTENAVRIFQQDNSLPVTGEADARTLRAMGARPNSNGTSALNARRYVVIIPIPDQTAFNRVQQVLPDAVPRQSRLGDFVRAGVYTTPEAADRRVENLRVLGFPNARVIFE